MTLSYKQRSYNNTLDDLSLDPLLQRIYGARGVESSNELQYDLKQLINPNEIYGLKEAADYLSEQIKKQATILIVGDYDADGATSTALMIKGLSALGVNHIDFILPDRVSEGYGLSEGLVNRILQHKPDLVITVDTGISSLKGIDTLKKNKIKVIVTDHHLPADSLPKADFIINPNAYDKSKSPSGRCLAGVGVAFYTLMAVRVSLREQNYFTDAHPEPNLAHLLDLVALGTVADLVPLDYLNRILVAQGLKLIRQQKCCEGISQLFSVSNKNQTQASHQDLGFAIAPKINAAGRIDDMALGVACLLSSGSESEHLASQLNDINSQRRSLQNDIQLDTEELLKSLNYDDLPKGLVLSDKDWHEGVVGIVASRIKAKTNRPVFIFAHAEDGSLKGSGRSIPGIHLRDALDLIDKQNDGLIIKFGGHAMAAGLSISVDKIDLFESVFNQLLDNQYDDELFKQLILIDGELSKEQLNLETAELIHHAGPWGQCFEEPVFFGRFNVIQKRILKEQHIKFVLGTDNSNQTYDAIAFSCEEDQLKSDYDTVTIIYKLSINEFRHQRNMQLIISSFEFI